MEVTTASAIGVFGDIAIKLIGTAPVGYEFLEYAFGGVMCIFFVKSIFTLIYMPFKALNKKM